MRVKRPGHQKEREEVQIDIFKSWDLCQVNFLSWALSNCNRTAKSTNLEQVAKQNMHLHRNKHEPVKKK